MRHIDLDSLLAQIFSGNAGKNAKTRLLRAHKKSARMVAVSRTGHAQRNGPNKWKTVKDLAMAVLGRKCWYTEVELIGASLVVDHYRPLCDYWWLAYDPENYRIACPWANSSEHNPLYGCAGGKGVEFPLVRPELRARGKNNLRIEKPVILDPCNRKDCELLAFQSDGRPVLNPAFANDYVARHRVEQSNILLNLDHPEFNSKREQLYHDICNHVKTYNQLPDSSSLRIQIQDQLRKRLSPKASFSVAAKFYLSMKREFDWVERLLNEIEHQ